MGAGVSGVASSRFSVSASMARPSPRRAVSGVNGIDSFSTCASVAMDINQNGRTRLSNKGRSSAMAGPRISLCIRSVDARACSMDTSADLRASSKRNSFKGLEILNLRMQGNAAVQRIPVTARLTVPKRTASHGLGPLRPRQRRYAMLGSPASSMPLIRTWYFQQYRQRMLPRIFWHIPQ